MPPETDRRSPPNPAAAIRPTSALGAPLLFVSVRSTDEASSALEGGADIIDVKEPLAGPLGAADPAVWRDVVREVAGIVPVPAAFGELIESGAPQPSATGLTYAKLGLAGAKGTAWPDRLDGWHAQLQSGGTGLVGVAYADHRLAGAPEPEAVLDYAIARGLDYFLVDTFDKKAGRLGDWLSPERLGVLVQKSHEASVRVAFAGSLRPQDFADMSTLGADLLAVRGAACEGNRREMRVTTARVAALRAEVARISHRHRSETL